MCGVPVPGTKEILQVTQNERKCKIFFLLYPNLGHSLAIFSEKHTLVYCTSKEQDSNKPLGHFGYYVSIGMAVSDAIQQGEVHLQRR